MAINPNEITTVRVDQLASASLDLAKLIPIAEVNGELKQSTIQALSDFIANVIGATGGVGFLPISVTDGQQLPSVPENPSFFLAGKGTYLNINGFPNIVCTDELNAIMSLSDHWELAVGIPIVAEVGVQTVTGSAVDNTDPLNPVINSTGGSSTLQEVTDNGNITTNSITVQGVTISGDVDNSVTNVGGSAGESSTGIAVSNLGYKAGENNTGNFVTNIGGRAGENNTGSNVTNIGVQTGQNNSGDNVTNIGNGAGQNNTLDNVINLGIDAQATDENQLALNTGIANTVINLPATPTELTLRDSASVESIAYLSDIVGGGVTSVSATSPITSSGGTTPNISTSMSTNKLIGRSTAGTGVMEEITLGTGLSFSGTTLNATGASPLTTKGDLYTFDTANTRLPIGLNNQVLTVDTTTATGLKWTAQNTTTPLGYYGAWQDMQTQTAAASNVGYPLIFRTIDLENQVRVITNGTNLTRITFDNTGIYNLQFSVQVQNTDNAQHDLTIWIRKNGVDVAGSSGFISVPARKSAGAGNEGHGVYGWNYLLSVVAGEYYEIVWSTSNSTHVTIQFYTGANPPPSTASVLATVTQQSGIMAGTGITAINSLTGAAQTLTTGTTGTDFAIVDSGTDHKFNLPDASDTARGVITTGTQTIAGAKTLSTAPILSSLNASQLLALDASKNIQTLSTATYPSLTELARVKGVTSAIQTQLNSKTTNLINDGTLSANVTGTTAETIIGTPYLITGGTVSSGLVATMQSVFLKTNTNNSFRIRMYVNTTANLSGSPQLFLDVTLGMSNLFAPFQRIMTFRGTSLIVSNLAATSINDISVNTSAPTTLTLNPANDWYIVLTATLGNSADILNRNSFLLRL